MSNIILYSFHIQIDQFRLMLNSQVASERVVVYVNFQMIWEIQRTLKPFSILGCWPRHHYLVPVIFSSFVLANVLALTCYSRILKLLPQCSWVCLISFHLKYLPLLSPSFYFILKPQIDFFRKCPQEPSPSLQYTLYYLIQHTASLLFFSNLSILKIS